MSVAVTFSNFPCSGVNSNSEAFAWQVIKRDVCRCDMFEFHVIKDGNSEALTFGKRGLFEDSRWVLY